MMRTERLLGLLLFLQTVACSDCPIENPLEIQPSTVVVRFGDPVSVNCTVSGDHDGIGWEASQGSVDMVTDVQFVTWSLETLTEWDIIPKCSVHFDNLGGPPLQCNESLNITVFKPPDSVSISAMNHTGPMLEGKQYQLQCEVQNIAPVQYLTVKWYKGETLVNQTFDDDLTKTPVDVSSTFLIKPTSADDGAQYSCVAELELGPEGPQPPPSDKSDPLNITVHYKPRITGCPKHAKLREGATLATLSSCRADGNPSPVVTWYKDRKVFDISTQLSGRSDGLYVLIARNIHGTSYHALQIKVLGPSLCQVEIQPSTVVVRFGDPVSLNCTASGNHDGIGWEASEGSVDMVTGVQPVSWRLESLTDWKIRPKCFAIFETDAGPRLQCDKRLNITVYKPPDSVSISVVNHTGPILEGKQYQLQCEVQNIAPVQHLTVKWYKGETLVNQTSYDDLTKTPVNVSSTLLITPTSADDGAQYSCVAELELGSEGPQPPPSDKSDPFYITVHCPVENPLEIQPSTVVVRFGDPVSVNCTASGNHDGIGWEASQGSVDMVTDVQFVTWSLETLTEWDIRPKCFVNFYNLGGPPVQCDKKLNTIVYKPPDSVSISVVNHTGPMLEGKQYQLQCEVQNIAPVQHLTVKWYKGETLVNQSSYNNLTKTPVNVSSTLLITPTSADDGAQYSCVAELELGPEGPQPPPSDKSDPLYITVHYKPRITGCPKHAKLREGVTLATLSSCRADGNPSPVVTWYKDRKEFDISTQLSGRSDGLYILIARNIHGTSYHPLEIKVLGRSQCELEIQPSTVVVRFGDSVSVNCTASGNHSGIGWEASEGSVDMVTGVQSISWNLESLTDWEIRSKCFSVFETDAGPPLQCDESLDITVYKPPDSVSISAVDHTGPILEGKLYRLQCEVQNIAPVQYLTVKWYKGETLVNETVYDDLTKTPVDVSSTLLITPTSADDGAQYSCVAELELGSEGPQPPPSDKSDSFNINVHYEPRITGCREHVKLREGVTLATLSSCRAEGNPSPVVTWYREQSEFSISTQLSGTLGGWYALIANNTYGTAIQTVEIEVLSPSLCQMEIQPSTVVLGFGDQISVSCTVSGDHDGIGWEASEGSVDMVTGVQSVSWRLESLMDWEMRSKCVAVFKTDAGPPLQCDERLSITVYKPPDSVSLSVVDHTGPMLEGKQYQLQCEVQNIAPVQHLIVKWYKGETLVNEATHDDLTKTPVNVSSTLLITPTSADDGAQYSCVAELELGSEGPQPPPSDKSDPLNISVQSYTGVMVGLIVVIVIVLLLILVFCFRMSKRRRGQYDVQQRAAGTTDPAAIPLQPQHSNGPTSCT